jgi:hypothetical protein
MGRVENFGIGKHRDQSVERSGADPARRRRLRTPPVPVPCESILDTDTKVGNSK